MNKDPEMQGNTQPNQDPQTKSATDTEARGQEVVLGPSDNLVVAEATLETELSDGTVVETTVVPKKKKHTGLIVVIVTFVILLLAGIGAGLWYFLCYNNPERVAYDAVHGLLERNSIISEGAFTGIIKGDEYNFRLQVSIDTKSSGASSSSDITFMVGPLDANGSALRDGINFKLSNVILSDGVFYIRTEELAEAVEELLAEASTASGDEAVTAVLEDMIAGILDTVDDEWWQVSVSEIIDLISDNGSDAQAAKEFYTCMVNAANQDIKGELAQLYSNDRFINISPADDKFINAANTVYNISFDYDKMANFVNAIPDGTTANSIYNCYNRYLDATGSSDERLSADMAGTVTAEEVAEDFATDKVQIQMSVDGFTHELKEIGIRSTENEDTLFNMTFVYQDVEVKAPESYRPITELFEDIVEVVMQALNSQYGGGYDYSIDEPWTEWTDPNLPINDDDFWNA